MRASVALSFLATSLTALVQCGVSPVERASAAGSAGSNGGSAPADAGPTSCPLDPPTLGTPCNVPPYDMLGVSEPGLCTYGTDPLPACRQPFACVNGVWAQATLYFGPCTSMAACPSSPGGSGTCSWDVTPACLYPEMTCVCGNDMNQPVWWCEPGGGPGCELIPNAGAACTSEGATCTYGCLLRVDCKSGVWLWDDQAPCS
jgi:hypothetical protein